MTHGDDDKDPNPILNIIGERVALGPMSRDQLEIGARWLNDFDTIRTMGAPPRPMTIEAEIEWYETIQRSDTDVLFVVYEREHMRPVGSVGLHRINWRHRTADYGIIIGDKKDRGRGYGTEATGLMLDYAFRLLGLRNVQLQVVEINEAGIRAYERAGFREFGRRRKAWFIEGDFYDQVFMDCLAEEFLAQESQPV